MRNAGSGKVRVVKAVHARRRMVCDPAFERDMSRVMKKRYSLEDRLLLIERFRRGDAAFDRLMRRVLWGAVAHAFGHGVQIEPEVGFKHLETFQIGDGVFIGSGAFLQGRFDGRFVIGAHSWIGPQSYFDARDLVLGEYVGWGPGASVIGSEHRGLPVNRPILATDLQIRPVRVGDGADIGAGAIVLPGVTIGKGSIVGAGAVVTNNVPPFAVVAGVPARLLRWRTKVQRKEGQ